MAASPVFAPPVPAPSHRRRPFALTSRRLEANRRNATRSTGPRTVAGKAKVARNGIKHGFFAGYEKWTPTQRRNFQEILDGLRDDFKPDGALEESCVATIAASYVRMAAMLRYENIAALKHHEEQERELNERIAVATPAEAAFLEAGRTDLRRAGLWGPTIPGPREAKAIIRYSGNIDRTIRRASSELEGLKAMRIGGIFRNSKVQKRCEASPNSVLSASRRTSSGTTPPVKLQKQSHCEASPSSVLRLREGPQEAPTSTHENAKANPLSLTFTGNRHARRRAKALAGRQT